MELLIRKEPRALSPHGREWEKGVSLPHLLAKLQRKWEFLEAVRFNTSVSLAAVPVFHDSAFHHLKHVIAFDDNKRIVARELSTVSENTEPPSASGPVDFSRRGVGTGGFSDPKGSPKGQASVGMFFNVRIYGWSFVHEAKARWRAEMGHSVEEEVMRRSCGYGR